MIVILDLNIVIENLFDKVLKVAKEKMITIYQSTPVIVNDNVSVKNYVNDRLERLRVQSADQSAEPSEDDIMNDAKLANDMMNISNTTPIEIVG